MKTITLYCVNISKTDKKKLLVIEKNKKPYYFQQIALQKCLVLDNYTAHLNVSLKNIKLEFVPLNTSLTQPLRMGVIQNLKLK